MTISDTKPPSMALIGDADKQHESGTNYVEVAVTASDLLDGAYVTGVAVFVFRVFLFVYLSVTNKTNKLIFAY